MAYIGNKPTVGNFQICDAISVVNGQAAYTMQVGSVNVIPQSANHMIVSLNGTIQKPNSSFTVSGAVITFSSNLVTNDVIDFIQILGDVLDLGVPSDATVTSAKIVDDAVTLQKMASGTDGNIISYDASGNPVAVATGSAGQVLTSAGAGAPPTFATPSAFTGLGSTSVYLTSDAAISGTGELSSNLGIYNRAPLGSGVVTDTSGGDITLDKTGWYLVLYQFTGNITSGSDLVLPYIRHYNGSSTVNHGYGYVEVSDGAPADNFTCMIHAIIDVTDTSAVKLRMGYSSASNITLFGTGQSVTSMTLIRLGDT